MDNLSCMAGVWNSSLVNATALHTLAQQCDGKRMDRSINVCVYHSIVHIAKLSAQDNEVYFEYIIMESELVGKRT